MKMKLVRIASMALVAVMAMSITFMPALAAEPTTEGFKANTNSTWGDAYRYLEPEEFEALPDFVQEHLNNTLVDSQTSDMTLSKSARGSASRNLAIASMDDMEDVVSATGYICSQEQDNQISRSINIKGLTSLHLGVTSRKTKMEVTAPLLCTVECPNLHCAVLLKDSDGTIL